MVEDIQQLICLRIIRSPEWWIERRVNSVLEEQQHTVCLAGASRFKRTSTLRQSPNRCGMFAHEACGTAKCWKRSRRSNFRYRFPSWNHCHHLYPAGIQHFLLASVIVQLIGENVVAFGCHAHPKMVTILADWLRAAKTASSE